MQLQMELGLYDLISILIFFILNLWNSSGWIVTTQVIMKKNVNIACHYIKDESKIWQHAPTESPDMIPEKIEQWAWLGSRDPVILGR